MPSIIRGGDTLPLSRKRTAARTVVTAKYIPLAERTAEAASFGATRVTMQIPSPDTDHPNAAAMQRFAGHPVAVAGWTAALEVCTMGADNLRDFQRVLRAPDVVFGHVLAGFRRNDTESFIEHLGAGSVERLRGSWRRHPAELLGTDGHQDILPFESFDQFIATFRTPSVPATRDSQKTCAKIKTGCDAAGASKSIRCFCSSELSMRNLFHDHSSPKAMMPSHPMKNRLLEQESNYREGYKCTVCRMSGLCQAVFLSDTLRSCQ